MKKNITGSVRRVMALGLASLTLVTSNPYFSWANRVYASDLTPTVIDSTVNPHFSGCTVDLLDKICLKFYLEFSTADQYSQRKATDTVKFTVNGVDTEVSIKKGVKISNTVYAFSCPLAAKEMADTVTATYVIKDNYGNSDDGNSVSYSVKEYAEYILANKGSNAEYQAAADTVNAMLNYGGYAQTYFGYNTSKLANANATAMNSSTVASKLQNAGLYNVICTKDSGYNGSFANSNGSYFSPQQYRLVLDDTVSFEFLFRNNVSNNEIKFSENGTYLATENYTFNGVDYIKVTVPGILAKNLYDEHTIYVNDGDVIAGTIKISPKHYCYSVYNSTAASTPLKNVLLALYDYYDKTKTYANGLPTSDQTGLVYGDFVYDRENSMITITRYTGNSSTVSIPKTIDGLPVTKIGKNGESIFTGNSNASNITNIKLPTDGTITLIGDKAFMNYTAPFEDTMSNYSYTTGTTPQLRDIPQVPGFNGKVSANIPASVLGVGNGAFTGIRVTDCKAAASVASVDSQGNVYKGTTLISASGSTSNTSATNMANLNVKAGTTSIAAYAAYGCTTYYSVSFPSTLKTIDEYAFYGDSNLIGNISTQLLDLPASCIEVKDFAFFGCDAIKKVKVNIVTGDNTGVNTQFGYGYYSFGRAYSYDIDIVLAGTFSPSTSVSSSNYPIHFYNANGTEITESFSSLNVKGGN